MGVCLFGLGVVQLRCQTVRAQGRHQNRSPRFANARWAVGVQALPLVGVSVRRAITRRVGAQVAVVSPFGGGKGAVGGRLLYRIDVQEARSLYVSGAYSVFFTPYHGPIVYPKPPPQEETEHTSVGALSLGAEFVLGFGFGVSVEFGGARVWTEHPDEQFFSPGVGAGLHFHW